MVGRIDQSGRQDYFGEGRQPWDEIVDVGFGPQFAAGSILKYIRRTKGEREKDIAKAAWYWARLIELSEDRVNETAARDALQWLNARLTLAEVEVIHDHG